MKLYYSPGACSLAPHIVMAELNMAYEIESVNLKDKTCTSGDYRKINPKGSVPAIKMDNGEILTEGAVISQYLADQKMEQTLLPKFGTMDRYRCMEWMNFISTEIHKNFSPLFGAKMTYSNETTQSEVMSFYTETLKTKLNFLNDALNGKTYLMGNTFTIADAYLFTCLNWSGYVKIDLAPWTNVKAYMSRVSERPGVLKAMKEEGLLK